MCTIDLRHSHYRRPLSKWSFDDIADWWDDHPNHYSWEREGHDRPSSA